MELAHTELDLRERRAIEGMLHAKVPVDQIATSIGRHLSTVYREIRRNRFEDNELPNPNGYYTPAEISEAKLMEIQNRLG